MINIHPDMIENAISVLSAIKREANGADALAAALRDTLPDDYPLDVLDAAVALISLCDF